MPNCETVNFAILRAGMVADYHRQAITANADPGARLVAVGHYDPGGAAFRQRCAESLICLVAYSGKTFYTSGIITQSCEGYE